jgi:hypothetical protein
VATVRGEGVLLPFEEIRGVARRIALTLVAEVQRQGVGRSPLDGRRSTAGDAKMWTPPYAPLRRRVGKRGCY